MECWNTIQLHRIFDYIKRILKSFTRVLLTLFAKISFHLSFLSEICIKVGIIDTMQYLSIHFLYTFYFFFACSKNATIYDLIVSWLSKQANIYFDIKNIIDVNTCSYKLRVSTENFFNNLIWPVGRPPSVIYLPKSSGEFSNKNEQSFISNKRSFDGKHTNIVVF